MFTWASLFHSEKSVEKISCPNTGGRKNEEMALGEFCLCFTDESDFVVGVL